MSKLRYGEGGVRAKSERPNFLRPYLPNGGGATPWSLLQTVFEEQSFWFSTVVLRQHLGILNIGGSWENCKKGCTFKYNTLKWIWIKFWVLFYQKGDAKDFLIFINKRHSIMRSSIRKMAVYAFGKHCTLFNLLAPNVLKSPNMSVLVYLSGL